jgi:hypothetical protein
VFQILNHKIIHFKYFSNTSSILLLVSILLFTLLTQCGSLRRLFRSPSSLSVSLSHVPTPTHSLGPRNNDFSNINPGSSSGGDSLSDVYVNTCGSNSACVTVCLVESLQGQCAAVGCSDDDDSDPDSLIKRSIMPRATLSCTSSESCYMYTNVSPLCLDLSNGACTLSTLLSILDTLHYRNMSQV